MAGLGLILAATIGLVACDSSGSSDTKSDSPGPTSVTTATGSTGRIAPGAPGSSQCTGWARLVALADQPPAADAASYQKNLDELTAIAALMRKDPPAAVAAPATHFADLIDQAARQMSPQGGQSAVGQAAAALAADQSEVVVLQNWVAKNCPH